MPTFPTENNLDILQSISDTLNVIGPKVNQIAEASDPETVKLNLLMAVIAAGAGILGVIFGFLGFLYSKRTANNVERTNKKNRLGISNRLIQIVYKRMVYVRTLINERSLISQNLLRSIYLPKFEDCFILEDYRNDSRRYSYLLSLKTQMNKFDSVVDSLIKKLDNKESLSDRDLLDFLQTPEKVLIELFLINKDKHKNYADRILSTIIEYHFAHISGSDTATLRDVSIAMPKPDDTGVLLYSKLCNQGPLKGCTSRLKKIDKSGLKQKLTIYLDSPSLDTYMSLLVKCAEPNDNPNADISSWLIAAWSLDSAIVQNHFQSYYELSI